MSGLAAGSCPGAAGVGRRATPRNTTNAPGSWPRCSEAPAWPTLNRAGRPRRRNAPPGPWPKRWPSARLSDLAPDRIQAALARLRDAGRPSDGQPLPRRPPRVRPVGGGQRPAARQPDAGREGVQRRGRPPPRAAQPDRRRTGPADPDRRERPDGVRDARPPPRDGLPPGRRDRVPRRRVADPDPRGIPPGRPRAVRLPPRQRDEEPPPGRTTRSRWPWPATWPSGSATSPPGRPSSPCITRPPRRSAAT